LYAGAGSVRLDLTAVLTNKCQQGAYRGFGSDVGNFVLERMVDAAVAELNDDPVQFRRRNFIQPDQFPYLIPTGNMYDSGNYPAVLGRALGLLDYAGWRKRQEEGRQSGRYIGIGIATCQERSVFSATEFWMLNEEPGFALTSPPESVSLRMDPTGKVFVALQAPFWGNSPETVATQVLAEQLQIDPQDIIVTYSDSDHGLNGTGPGGSRFTVMLAGLAAHYRAPVPPLADYVEAIEGAPAREFGGSRPRLLIEPGRYLVGDAGLLRTEILLISEIGA
jgi:CO/xanthine dehydrogenase Mo-binding subunit